MPATQSSSSNSNMSTVDVNSTQQNVNKPGGYYLDDGPEANPPTNLDSIPDAVPKKEPLLPRSNKPYVALGQTYQPMTTSQVYKKRGVASWYGKRFHGKKTSSGEIYDMYAMTAAHTILPLPSYAKVTNVENGRSVIVRINDRGPFKKDRIIDLSYAAAHKLRLIARGSGLVEVETLNQNSGPSANTATMNALGELSVKEADDVDLTYKQKANNGDANPDILTTLPTATSPSNADLQSESLNGVNVSNGDAEMQRYYVQAGAFKNESNAESLLKRIQDLDMAQNVGINRVYNNALHRLKLGPFRVKLEAEQLATQLRKQLNIPAIILNQ